MNTKPFTQKNILSSIQVACKTLIILILSLLLIAPTPAWALDYNGTLQSYVSKVKVELDGVVTSIQKLPSLSYDNGKTALADIDNKLEKIKNDAGQDAAYFQKLSDQLQLEYQTNPNTVAETLPINLNDQELEDYKFIINFNLFPRRDQRRKYLQIVERVTSQSTAPPNLPQNIWDNANTIQRLSFYEQSIKLHYVPRLVVLTNKISKLSDQLEKRINLATQKFGNVKEYADALNSFSDPDVLTEITELNTSLAKLTENLAIAA